MKKLTCALLTSFLLFGTAACSNVSKTSANAGEGLASYAPTKSEARQDLSDARNQIRRRQLDLDLQAREQRNNFFNHGSAANRSDNDLASEVRDRIEANLPSSELSVAAQDGIVTVSGTVPTSEQFARIQPLARQIKGVRGVSVNAMIAAAGSHRQS